MKLTREFKMVCLILALTLGFCGIVGGGWWIWDRFGPRGQMEAKTRAEIPFKSIVERLPKGKPIAPTKPLDADAQSRWQDLDNEFASNRDEVAKDLKALHERTRRFFVNYPGQGSGRSFIADRDAYLANWKRADPADQEGEPADFPLSQGEKMVYVKANDALYDLHRFGLLAFLVPDGFGYLKDREHVAGFWSHGFGNSYTTWHLKHSHRQPWQPHYVQLVGILTHEQPLVYLTDKMPSMDQIRQGKTRGLDIFEEVALPALAKGDDLYIVQKNDTIRMLGAIRATKTCQKCHDAEIGDLLGAFSYTLRPAPKEVKADE